MLSESYTSSPGSNYSYEYSSSGGAGGLSGGLYGGSSPHNHNYSYNSYPSHGGGGSNRYGRQETVYSSAGGSKEPSPYLRRPDVGRTVNREYNIPDGYFDRMQRRRDDGSAGEAIRGWPGMRRWENGVEVTSGGYGGGGYGGGGDAGSRRSWSGDGGGGGFGYGRGGTAIPGRYYIPGYTGHRPSGSEVTVIDNTTYGMRSKNNDPHIADVMAHRFVNENRPYGRDDYQLRYNYA